MSIVKSLVDLRVFRFLLLVFPWKMAKSDHEKRKGEDLNPSFTMDLGERVPLSPRDRESER